MQGTALDADEPQQLRSQQDAAPASDPEQSPGKAAGASKRPGKRQRTSTGSDSKPPRAKKVAKKAVKGAKPQQESGDAAGMQIDMVANMQPGTGPNSGQTQNAKPGKSSSGSRKGVAAQKGIQHGPGSLHASPAAASAANAEDIPGSSAQPDGEGAPGGLSTRESLGSESLPSSADDSAEPQADAAPKQSPGEVQQSVYHGTTNGLEYGVSKNPARHLLTAKLLGF